jgi:hypothetical protein
MAGGGYHPAAHRRPAETPSESPTPTGNFILVIQKYPPSLHIDGRSEILARRGIGTPLRLGKKLADKRK